MRRNLEQIAADAVTEYLTTDADPDRQATDWMHDFTDRAHEEADSAVIYHTDALDIIRQYENHDAAPDQDESGAEYRADQWQEAATAWAYQIARAVIEHAARRHLLDAAAAMSEVLDMAPEDAGPTPALDTECPHGWAPHDAEEDKQSGTLYLWESAQLDGLNGASIKVHGLDLWISATWE